MSKALTKAKQKEYAKEMAELVARIEAVSALQATVFEAYHRAGWSVNDIARVTRLQPDRIQRELHAAHATVVAMVCGEALTHWQAITTETEKDEAPTGTSAGGIDPE